MATTFRILGPLEVRVGDRPVALGGPKPRAVLAILLLRAGGVVATDALIEGLWGSRPPPSARGAVQVYVSQLRRALAAAEADDASIETAGAGYVVHVAPGALDLARFDARAAEGRVALDGDDPAGASEAYGEALALWRGPALADFTYDEFAQPEIAHLEDRRLAAVEARIDADLRLGRHAELVPELERLVAEHPLRERPRGQLMVALSGSGRQADALERYAAGRRTMVDELGIEPGTELRELEARILRQDPDLAPARAPPRPAAGRPAAVRARVPWPLALAVAAAAIVAGVALWAALHGGHDRPPAIPGDALVGIDVRSGGATAPVVLGGSPSGVVLADGSVWVGDVSRGAVERVDPERGAVIQTIPVGSGPDGIGAGDGAVWATDALAGTLLRISPETDAVVQTIRVPTGPRGVAVAGDAVWVASRYARSVTRVDARTGDVELTAHIGGSPIGIAVGFGSVWTTHEGDAGVWRLDPATGRVQQRIGVGNAPGPIQVGGGAVWVANTLDGTVSRIDPATDAVVATVRVGDGPAALAVTDDGVWVADELGGTLVRIDPRTDAVAERIETGGRPAGLAADGGRLWVAAGDASAVHRGGTLRVGVPSIESANPGYSTIAWMDLTGDGLTGYRRAAGAAGASLVPDLATSLPTPTDGGRTYTFALRRGVRYSTGEPVRAGDVRRAIERFFRLRAPQSPDYYDRIVGAAACRRDPATCDLSRGIVADPGAGTVTIHLTAPQPDLLQTLALPFAHLVAASVPPTARMAGGLPATGPYVIASHVPGREVRFVRNPAFHEWSRTVRPDGYPDEILVTVADDRDALRAAERGGLDVALPDRVAPATLERLAVRHPDRLASAPLLATHMVFLNTTRPPFDRLDARRAVAYALDRGALVAGEGGGRTAQTTCQVLPPSFPAYAPYCPFTSDAGDGRWHGPRLDDARALVGRSGTAGTAVAVTTPPELRQEARRVAATLGSLGYRAHVRRMSSERFGAAAYGPATHMAPQAGLSGWAIDYPAPSTFFEQFRCGAADPARFCDPAVDRQIDAALALQRIDPAAADERWARLDRTMT
ncbi:MAG TPA: BTAD domain-containing putative transcriptional regulator, partial [Miltoncostaea sp.]|nr:BTAD domain-containing putative transcriptional regulator [Miltoncostaea sp.]